MALPPGPIGSATTFIDVTVPGLGAARVTKGTFLTAQASDVLPDGVVDVFPSTSILDESLGEGAVRAPDHYRERAVRPADPKFHVSKVVVMTKLPLPQMPRAR